MPTQRHKPIMSPRSMSPKRYSSSNLLHTLQGRVPHRSTIKTEKLVLIPEEDEGHRFKLGTTSTSNAEMNKDQRSLIPRVTSYCIAKKFDLEKIQEFVKHSHGIKSKRFDECLYFSYDELTKEMLFGRPNSAFNNIPAPYGNYQHRESAVSSSSAGSQRKEYNSIKSEFMTRGEAFIFDYGVIVLWNFSLDEETEFMSHLVPYGSEYLDEAGFIR